jgi:hypothetical protein
MVANATGNPQELLDQATKTYFGAIKKGLKTQEDLATRWLDLCGKTEGGEYVPAVFQHAIKEAIPVVEKQTDEALKMVENGTRRGLDLLAEAFESGRIATPGDTELKMEKLWENSLGAMRETAEVIVRTNTQMLEAWTGVLKKTSEAAPVPPAKPAGTKNP